MPETMSPKARQALEKWHKEQRDKKVAFDFPKELVAYCESDVRLLKEGCLTFKRLFEAQAGFNPFEHITIASACNRDLRMNRMIPDSIASEPVNGWRNRVNQQVALEWLTWCDQQRRQEILPVLERLSPEGLEAHHNLMTSVTRPKSQVQEFDNPQTFHRFLDTDTLEVRHVSVINDHMVEVHYKYQEEDIPMSPNLNIFVASFTTCWDRLCL